MGLFDSFLNEDERLEVQLKNGDVSLRTYHVGDACPLPDAFYYGHEGVVVIRAGKVESVTVRAPDNSDPSRTLPCFTKYGEPFYPDPGDTLADHLAISRSIANRQRGKP